MSAMTSQITSLTIVYSNVYSGADQREHQSSASLAFVRGIHWWPVNSPQKGPVTRKMFPFDDIIMKCLTNGIAMVTHNISTTESFSTAGLPSMFPGALKRNTFYDHTLKYFMKNWKRFINICYITKLLTSNKCPQCSTFEYWCFKIWKIWLRPSNDWW